MRRVVRYLSLTVGLLYLLVIWGCGPKPWVVKADAGVNFQRYTVLVAKDFRNGVGETLPANVTRDLPKEVIAHLSECYPGGFAKLDRTGSGSAEELIIEGTITEYHEGSRAGRYLLPGVEAWNARFASDVSFVDGQSGRELIKAKVDLVFKHGGVVGALGGIETLIERAGANIADTIAEKKGISKAESPVQPGRKTEGPPTGRSC